MDGTWEYYAEWYNSDPERNTWYVLIYSCKVCSDNPEKLSNLQNKREDPFYVTVSRWKVCFIYKTWPKKWACVLSSGKCCLLYCFETGSFESQTTFELPRQLSDLNVWSSHFYLPTAESTGIDYHVVYEAQGSDTEHCEY